MAEGAAHVVPARTIDVRLTLPQLWVALAILLPVLGALLASVSTVDLAYHLRAGAIVLDSGRLPSPDTFTFTAGGLAWLDQQWGAQAFFAALDRAGGWALLAVVRAALVGLTSLLVYRGCRLAGAGMRPAAWLTLGGFAVGLVALGLRPQLLAMVLFAATLAILAGRTRRSALVWAIPVLVAIWANVHGSFFLGPAAVVVAWLDDRAAGRRERRLALVAAVSALATLANPFGPGVWTYAAGLAIDPTIRRLITEWQATAPLSFAGAMFYGSLVGVVAILVLALRRASDRGGATRAFLRRSWPTLLWLAGLAAIGAYAERGVAWWSIAFPIALAGLLEVAADARVAARSTIAPTADSGGAAPAVVDAPGGPRAAPPASLVATAIVVVLIVGVVALLPLWRGSDPLYGPAGLLTDAPRGITDTLLATARPGDRIWNAQRWGSWLEYAVPATPVAVDSRIELIPADAWADHLALSGGAADWAAILDRRGVTIVVASATEQRSLIERMRASTAWRPIHDDADGVVFVRADR